MLRRFFRSISTERIRNVGIIAHIDAGKTTTTERILYYVGYTKRIGNVDDGSTVTDFLKTERERGITIQSVCIPFGWNDHKINLIDTPGHVDFTIEVERSLRVLDGSVVILDGVAGVEAQTVKVWNQANNYKIPRLVFVNKMDRLGASLWKSLDSMKTRLQGWGKPLLLQLPVFKKDGKVTTDEGNDFAGVIDLIKMKQLDFGADPTGSVVTESEIDEQLREKAIMYRGNIIDDLSDLDEEIIEKFMETEDPLQVSNDLIRKSIRRNTILGEVVPVFCGASFRNIGVQPLLDGIVDYLPNPLDVPSVPIKNPLCALAFKIVHDPMRGPLVFVRVYSGSLESKSVLRISGSNTKERATKLMEVYADDLEEIPRIEAGNIGCIIGLKHTKTGDTLVASNDKRDIKLHSITIPPPVFVRSCTVDSISEEQKLQLALDQLQREDPSFHVSFNEETGQTLLSGMGELHLEIMGERLLEHNVNAQLGKVEISYRETCLEPNEYESLYDTDLFGKQQKCLVGVGIECLEGDVQIDIVQEKMVLNGDTNEPYQGSIRLSEIREAFKEGITNGLTCGPILGYPVTHLKLSPQRIRVYHNTTVASIRQAAYQAIQHLLKNTSSCLLQPMMYLQVTVLPQHVGSVNRDLSGTRRGSISEMSTTDGFVKIDAVVALSELIGYASALRGMTQGSGEFVMQLRGYEPVTADIQSKIMQSLRGF